MNSIRFFLILIIFPLVMFSQTTGIIHYGIEQGLGQTQIQNIIQDKEGNLLIGTLSGLVKYNGKKFTNYTRNDSLAEDWVTTLYKDKQNNIWIGHWAGGVSMLNAKSKRIENLYLEEYTQFKTVTSIVQDKKNRYWIATEGAGIFVFDPITEKMGTITKKDGLSSDNVYSLIIGPKENIWVATDIGITIFDVNNIEEHSILNIGNGLHSNRITTLQLVNKNEIWVGSADAGIKLLIVNDNFEIKNPYTAISNSVTFSQKQGLSSDFINCILEDNNSNIWIGTTGGGAYKIIPEKNDNRFLALTNATIQNYNTKQGLNYFNANAIFQDYENNIWIGTDIGLNQYRGERFQLFDEADGLINNLVWTTLADKNGNIWIGTNQGLSKLSFSKSVDNKIIHTVENYTTANGLAGNVIMSSFEDSKGNLWFGTGFGGVSKYNYDTKTFTNYDKNSGLSADVVYSINEDENGNIWFGTKEGATKLNVKDNTFRSYSVADGLGGNNIYRIFKDSKGNIWFGALGGNLSMFDGISFKRFGEADGINHRFILSINEDKKNNMWFGTYGGGVYKYSTHTTNGKGKKFTNYNTQNGLSANTVYSIIADDNNNIWIGAGNGLDKLNTQTYEVTHYGKSEGFLGVEINPNAACKDLTGNIWYGTIMGAVKYNPKEDISNLLPPKTMVTGLKLFMNETPFPDDAKFNYDKNHLTFSFLGVSLTSPAQVKYNYKLEGFDKDWLPNPTTANEATYANLPPGQYTFKVKSCNSDGVWNQTPVEYSFFVSPPFWQTAFFYVSLFVFFIFGIYVFDKMRTRKLKETARKLEEKVNDRTMELAAKNAELASKNKEITDSLLYAKKIQDAILLPDAQISKIFQNAFVYFKPKDFVSGDFYWIQKNNDHVIFAVADCTGHGMPGALMSLIGYNSLSQAVTQTANNNPSEILNNLNIIFNYSLKQKSAENKLIDGMDIALCVLNTNTMQLQFAGAYCPLIIIRQNEQIKINGEPIAIGNSKNTGNSYKNHTIQLHKNDSIYIFSDGFIDQYGGAENKKFGAEQFMSLLVRLASATPAEQKSLLEKTLSDWQKENAQVDDILLMGIKV